MSAIYLLSATTRTNKSYLHFSFINFNLSTQTQRPSLFSYKIEYLMSSQKLMILTNSFYQDNRNNFYSKPQHSSLYTH